MFTYVHCYPKLPPSPPLTLHCNLIPVLRIQRKVSVQGYQGVSFAPTMCVYTREHGVTSVWKSNTLLLPIMHCGKGNTHFAYLEQCRDGSYQPERGVGGLKETNLKEDLELLALYYLGFSLLVDFVDKLDAFIDTLECVFLHFGVTRRKGKRWDGQREELQGSPCML